MSRAAPLLAAALCGIGTMQAAALGCVTPDPARAFDAALASEDRFIVVAGSFDFDAAARPADHNGEETSPSVVPARFAGQGLTFEGFTTPLSMAVTLRATCVGPWCGSLTPGAAMLAFLRLQPGGYVLDVAPCPAWHFDTPTPADLARVHRCLVKGGCASTD